MSDFAAGLIAGGCVILSVVLTVVSRLLALQMNELGDLLRERIAQCEDEIDELNPQNEKAIEDLRDAIKLLIARDRHVPWRTVADSDVDGLVEEIRKLKSQG